MSIRPPPQRTPEHQPEAQLDQAAPVNGTFYTVLAPTDLVELEMVMFRVQTTGEDLECEITVDGEVYTSAQTAVAGTAYYAYIAPTGIGATSGTRQGLYPGGTMRGKNIGIRIRKVTANGAGNLQAYAAHGILKP